jgi:hypothetical protein
MIGFSPPACHCRRGRGRGLRAPGRARPGLIYPGRAKRRLARARAWAWAWPRVSDSERRQTNRELGALCGSRAGTKPRDESDRARAVDGRCAIPFVWPAGADLIAKLVYGVALTCSHLCCVCGEEGGSDARTTLCVLHDESTNGAD